MAVSYMNRAFYEAILNFDHSEKAQDYYYKVMDLKTGKKKKSGEPETVRDQILRIYGMLFCDDLQMEAEQAAGPDEVELTADRLYIGEIGLDPAHWYRMQHHFPVIDDDNYDRFAALVIADLSAGPLHEAARSKGDMLLLGEADPLHLSASQRKNQRVSTISYGTDEVEKEEIEKMKNDDRKENAEV